MLRPLTHHVACGWELLRKVSRTETSQTIKYVQTDASTFNIVGTSSKFYLHVANVLVVGEALGESSVGLILWADTRVPIIKKNTWE